MALIMTILVPGRTREPWLKAGVDEYVKRLKRYCQVELITVQDVSEQRPAEQVLELEGKALLQHIRPQHYVVALDLNGRQVDSPQLALDLNHWFEAGGSHVVFVIGGACGLHGHVLERAQQRLCLSKLTWTHQMARLLLLEQCYRAFRIMNNEPYHK